MIDRLSVEVAYVSRDPRAIVADLRELGDVSEEEVQMFSKQLCARMNGFRGYQPSSHYMYQVGWAYMGRKNDPQRAEILSF